jgi:hypothetical protein
MHVLAIMCLLSHACYHMLAIICLLSYACYNVLAIICPACMLISRSHVNCGMPCIHVDQEVTYELRHVLHAHGSGCHILTAACPAYILIRRSHMNCGMSCMHVDQEVTYELRLAIICLRGSQYTRSEPGVEVVWKFRVGWCRSGSAAGLYPCLALVQWPTKTRHDTAQGQLRCNKLGQ